jgi:hypothetical protein
MAGYGSGELLDLIDEILAEQFDDAPRLIKSTVNLAFRAIRGRNYGEALNKLRKAEKLLDAHMQELADWRAEVAALWALYYLNGGPKSEPNAMWVKLREAQRLEPENERLMRVIELVKEARGQR